MKKTNALAASIIFLSLNASYVLADGHVNDFSDTSSTHDQSTAYMQRDHHSDSTWKDDAKSEDGYKMMHEKNHSKYKSKHHPKLSESDKKIIKQLMKSFKKIDLQEKLEHIELDLPSALETALEDKNFDRDAFLRLTAQKDQISQKFQTQKNIALANALTTLSPEGRKAALKKISKKGKKSHMNKKRRHMR